MRLFQLFPKKSLILTKFTNISYALFSDIPSKDDHNAPGHFSGLYDDKGHHLKSDHTHDKRFKENNPDAGNPGPKTDNRGKFTGEFDRSGHPLKSDGTQDLRFKENNPEAGNPGRSDDNRGQFSGEFDKKGHHLKSDGEHDHRFKENKGRDVSPEEETSKRN